jgi:hypothetical protein
MRYILTGAKPNSEEFCYFKSLEDIQKHIEAKDGGSADFSHMRIFKLEREIDVDHLFGPQKYS